MRKPGARFPDLKAAAAAYLTRYASSSANLKRVLSRRVHRWTRLTGKDAPEDATARIAEAVAAAERVGLLNDAAFAAARTKSLRQRGWGARRIRAGLSAKGVARPEIDAALGDVSEEDELAAAQRYAERRRLGPWRDAALRAEKRQKDIAALVRAGFAIGLARKVIEASG